MDNDAPKRIWACPDDAEWITGHWDRASDGLPMEAEYIRADHAQAELDRMIHDTKTEWWGKGHKAGIRSTDTLADRDEREQLILALRSVESVLHEIHLGSLSPHKAILSLLNTIVALRQSMDPADQDGDG